MSMEKYKIRKFVEQPIKIPLLDPRTQEVTDDFLLVRSSMSDAFIETRDRIMQEVQTINEPDKKRRAEIVKELQLQLRASLVAGWSFPEEMNEQTLLDFLREAPQVQEMLMNVADRTASFFENGSPS